MRVLHSKSAALALAVILVLAMSVPAFANDVPADDCACGDAFTTDLIAGGGNEASAMDVGDVIVRNCESTVCVEYVLDDEAIAEGWVITETHVEVASALGGIPQTKKGNPIPGQFEDVQYHMPGVTSYSYCANFADMDLAPGDDVYIAAHAVVTRPSDGCWSTVWQIGDVEEVDTASGLLNNYADEFNWEYPAGPQTAGPSLAVSQPAYADPFIVGSSETTDFPYNSNADRGYATDFDVEWMGALPWGGRLTVSWSPGISAAEQKTVMVAGDGLGSETFNAVGTPRPGEGWFLDKYALVENSMSVGSLPYDTHTINFTHPTGDGTFWDWVRLEQPCVESETAWGDGIGFPGKNWATYIVYTLEECCEPCEAPFYASEVVSSSQGLRKDGTAVRVGRSNPDAALTYEATQSETDFFSLGFGGEIVLAFPCAVVDGPGDDIRVVEDTWGSGYPLETADVFAWDGATWVLLGVADNSDHGTYWQTQSFFDLADEGLASTSMIKIVDTTNPDPHNSNADGFDVNWVEALWDSTACP
jgi:hypothetical protein